MVPSVPLELPTPEEQPLLQRTKSHSLKFKDNSELPLHKITSAHPPRRRRRRHQRRRIIPGLPSLNCAVSL
jgi:hypothetical protein